MIARDMLTLSRLKQSKVMSQSAAYNSDIDKRSSAIIFVSCRSEDPQIEQLGNDLRERARVPVFICPFDLDEAGESLTANIERFPNRSRVLILALSAGSNHWFERSFPVLLRSFEPELEEISVVKLVPLPEAEIPTSLADFPLWDLSGENYTHGLQALLEDVGGPADIRSRPTLGPSYHSVQGIFEVDRTQHSMFAELKRQVAEGELDQKYLYWDVRASVRWKKIANDSTYKTSQATTNIWVSQAGALLDPILESAKNTHLSFINFGVGTGFKDKKILEYLLGHTSRHVLYFPIDESLSMIQITIQDLQDVMLEFGERLHLSYILDDFKNVDIVERYVRRTERGVSRRDKITRVLGLLGGSLGNFKEIELLSRMRQVMRANDFLILGVEYVADRSDQDLIKNYSDQRMKEFLYGPIADLEGYPDRWESLFRYEIRVDDPTYSDVPDSRTVIGRVQHRQEPIDLFYATKYEPAALEAFLDSLGFLVVSKVVSEDEPPRVGKYLLRRKANN